MEIRLKTDDQLHKQTELIKNTPLLGVFEAFKTKIFRNYIVFDYESNTEVPMTEIKNVLVFRCLKDIYFATRVNERSVFTWGIAIPESKEEEEILNDCDDNGKIFKSFFLVDEILLEKDDALILPKGTWFYFHIDNYAHKLKGTFTLP